MFSHVTLGTRDLDRAIAFYDAVLLPLGLVRHETDHEHGAAGWAREPHAVPQFWVMRPYDGGAPSAGNGVTVAFDAPDRESVRRFHAAVLAAGGSDEGQPGLRPHYHPDYFGAYVRDLDGNKLCCVCHSPDPA